jgi:hypothetical protein
LSQVVLRAPEFRLLLCHLTDSRIMLLSKPWSWQALLALIWGICQIPRVIGRLSFAGCATSILVGSHSVAYRLTVEGAIGVPRPSAPARKSAKRTTAVWRHPVSTTCPRRVVGHTSDQ